MSATAVGSVGVADGAQGVEAEGAIRVGLRSFPPDIRDLTIDGPMMEGYKTLQPVFHLFSRLRGLLVMGTPLASLPAVLGASPTLVDLTLRSNHVLTSIEEGFFSGPAAAQLECLTISDSPKLVELPSQLELCTTLQSLCISQCKVTTIPDGVFYLGRLSYLRLFGNQLTALPAYWSMVYLIELDVGNNNLTALPDGVCSCLQLRVLKVQRNHLVSLPDDFGRLKTLEDFDCSYNVIVELPPSFSELMSLSRFTGNYNRLKTLPDMTGLVKLREVSLEHNRIELVPTSLLRLRYLTHVLLRGNPLYDHRTDTCGRDVLELQTKRLIAARDKSRAEAAAAALASPEPGMLSPGFTSP